MAVSEKTWRALKDLGLTQYEIKAYVALLARGPMQANLISREAEVPYSKIYEVLGNLEKKGWIETNHDRPARYYSKSPSMALETVKTKVESDIKRNESQVVGELQPLYESKETRERPSIWIVRGEFNILTRIRQTLSGCERELLIAIPTILDEVVDLLTPTLSTLKNRGVKMTVMTTKDVDTKVLNRLAYLSELRVRDQMFGGGVIRDAKEVILLLGEEEQSASTLAICSEHLGLAKLAKSYFTYLWKEAKPYR
ncbi:MAG: TrmB family transcriptional regulator [Nitrososphaerales archaeon]